MLDPVYIALNPLDRDENVWETREVRFWLLLSMLLLATCGEERSRGTTDSGVQTARPIKPEETTCPTSKPPNPQTITFCRLGFDHTSQRCSTPVDQTLGIQEQDSFCAGLCQRNLSVVDAPSDMIKCGWVSSSFEPPARCSECWPGWKD